MYTDTSIREVKEETLVISVALKQCEVCENLPFERNEYLEPNDNCFGTKNCPCDSCFERKLEQAGY